MNPSFCYSAVGLYHVRNVFEAFIFILIMGWEEISLLQFSSHQLAIGSGGRIYSSSDTKVWLQFSGDVSQKDCG